MAKCAECGGSGKIEGMTATGMGTESECYVCDGTGTEPQEVAKVELAVKQIENFCEKCDGECSLEVFRNANKCAILIAVKELINTAVLAERDRIMAGLPKTVIPDEQDSDYSEIRSIGRNEVIAEVKKIIRGI